MRNFDVRVIVDMVISDKIDKHYFLKYPPSDAEKYTIAAQASTLIRYRFFDDGFYKIFVTPNIFSMLPTNVKARWTSALGERGDGDCFIYLYKELRKKQPTLIELSAALRGITLFDMREKIIELINKDIPVKEAGAKKFAFALKKITSTGRDGMIIFDIINSNPHTYKLMKNEYIINAIRRHSYLYTLYKLRYI
jgi:hypothetical protein